MSVQSFKQQSNYKGNLWIDSRTNVSAMGRSFKMIEETGSFCWGYMKHLILRTMEACCYQPINLVKLVYGLLMYFVVTLEIK
eukprot:12125521-Ditylum_brightwellii.AAC.1